MSAQCAGIQFSKEELDQISRSSRFEKRQRKAFEAFAQERWTSGAWNTTSEQPWSFTEKQWKTLRCTPDQKAALEQLLQSKQTELTSSMVA